MRDQDKGPPYEIVAFASSAGGLPALMSILSSLPAQFAAPIVIVQHLDPRHGSLLAGLLSRRSVLKVVHAEEGDALQAGCAFIAPPDRHLLVVPDATLSCTSSELVPFLRASADLLLEPVAAVFRHRALAVVLTGTGSDGSIGVRAIKKMGGSVIAQDEAASEFFGMPGAAIETGCVDFVLPLEENPGALLTLVNGVDDR